MTVFFFFCLVLEIRRIGRWHMLCAAPAPMGKDTRKNGPAILFLVYIRTGIPPMTPALCVCAHASVNIAQSGAHIRPRNKC